MLKDISLIDTRFAEAVGFTEADIRRALTEIGVETDEEQKPALEVMRRFYNGYHFRGSREPLYNSTQCLFFLDRYLNNPEIITPTDLMRPLNNSEITISKMRPFREFVSACAKGEYQLDAVIPTLQDSNIKASDSVLGLLSRSPGVKIPLVQDLLAYKGIPTTLVGSFKLREILETEPMIPDRTPAGNRYAESAYQRALSMMYYHGMVTTDHSDPNYVRVPNELVANTLVQELKRVITIDAGDVHMLFDNPTETQTHSLLWGIVSQQQTLHDNFFSEGALQGEVESALRAMARGAKGQPYIVECEDPNKRLPLNRRTDLVLQRVGSAGKDPEVVIVFEFKRIRPNALLMEDNKFSTTEKWTTNLLKSFNEATVKMSAENMRAIEIRKDYRKLYNNYATVGAVEEAGQVQLQNYVSNLRNDGKYPKDTPIHAFTVTQVGWPLLVKKL